MIYYAYMLYLYLYLGDIKLIVAILTLHVHKIYQFLQTLDDALGFKWKLMNNVNS